VMVWYVGSCAGSRTMRAHRASRVAAGSHPCGHVAAVVTHAHVPDVRSACSPGVSRAAEVQAPPLPAEVHGSQSRRSCSARHPPAPPCTCRPWRCRLPPGRTCRRPGAAACCCRLGGLSMQHIVACGGRACAGGLASKKRTSECGHGRHAPPRSHPSRNSAMQVRGSHFSAPRGHV
jgi:hypothetical protein